jgi:hypothetical protein
MKIIKSYHSFRKRVVYLVLGGPLTCNKDNSNNYTILGINRNRCAQSFQTSSSQLKTAGARRVTGSKLHTEDPQILGATAQNVVATATWHPGFVHPCTTLVQIIAQKYDCTLMWSDFQLKSTGQRKSF